MPRYVPEDSLQTPRFTGPATFARLPHVRTTEEVDVAFVGVPFDTGVTYRVGGRFGPNAVRAYRYGPPVAEKRLDTSAKQTTRSPMKNAHTRNASKL